MTVTKEQFNDAYASATETQKYLCSRSGTQLRTIADKYNLTEESYRKFSIIAGETILGFHKKIDLPTLLIQEINIDESRAIKLSADLIYFFNPLDDPNWKVPEDEPEEYIVTNKQKTITDEIAEAEAALKSLANNAANELNKIEEEKIYPSQQSDLIQTKNTPPPTSPPRWESES